MYEVDSEVEAWGGYMGDVATVSTLAIASRGMGALAYAPDLSPVGSGAAGTYYPRDTKADAEALNYLGLFPDALLAAHVGTSGSQKADMAAHTGAWSPAFQKAVKAFQAATGLGVDGWIGPGTRTKLAAKVAEKNAKSGLDLPIPNVVPVIPNVVPSPSPSPAPKPAAAKAADHTKLYLGIGAVVALGVGVLLLRK